LGHKSDGGGGVMKDSREEQVRVVSRHFLSNQNRQSCEVNTAQPKIRQGQSI
jgi:hypothetical protein